MKKYFYNGPVMYFDNCISNCWYGSTCANTKKKARSNLEFQFKKENNYNPNAKIRLSGEMIIESEGM